MIAPRLLPRRMPLRARLTLTYAVLFLLAGVVLLGVTYALFTQQLSGPKGRVIAKTIHPQPTSASPKSEAAGAASPKAGASAAAQSGAAPSPQASGQDPDRQLTVVDLAGGTFTGEDAEKLAREQQKRVREVATTSLLTQGGIALLVVGGAAAGLGWLIAGQMLAPLHRVTETARRIASAPAADRGLHERIALHGPDDEVKELADTFDTMLERLDRSFDGQRRFVANASHELRTPLTLGRALVEVAMHRTAASPDVRQLGAHLLEINSRHERLITGLLLLAGSENEITDPAPVDLADILQHVAAQTAPEAEAAGVTVRWDPGEAPTTGDALLLERLVQNLVENAIRHNTDGGGGWVRVASRTGGGRAELEVANSGPAVPPYEIPRLFEPFHRVNADRLVTAVSLTRGGATPHTPRSGKEASPVTANGVGLGLSIVRSVARAHGGEITARPRDGGGLTVTVALPPDPGLEPAAPPSHRIL